MRCGIIAAKAQKTLQVALHQFELAFRYVEAFVMASGALASMQLDRQPAAGRGISHLMRDASKELAERPQPLVLSNIGFVLRQHFRHPIDRPAQVGNLVIAKRYWDRLKIAFRDFTDLSLQSLQRTSHLRGNSRRHGNDQQKCDGANYERWIGSISPRLKIALLRIKNMQRRSLTSASTTSHSKRLVKETTAFK